MASELQALALRAARINAGLLRVPVPRLVWAPKGTFTTETTRAALSEDGKSIALNRDLPFSPPDVWLTVSHEMRHLWQRTRGRIREGYQPSAALPLADYNAQPEEIDANAWAVVVAANVLQKRPTLENNLGPEIWKQIEARAAEITNEMNSPQGRKDKS